MPTSHLLTGDLSDLVGSDFPPRSVWVTIETNLGDQVVLDGSGNQVRLPRHRFALASDGTFSKSLWSTAALTAPTGYQYRVKVEYPDGPGGTAKKTWESGWFSHTSAQDLSEVVPEALVPPQYVPELLTARNEAQAAAVEAQAAQAGAEAAQSAAEDARDDVEAVVATTDGLMTTVDANASSAFRVQQDARLMASYAPKATQTTVDTGRLSTTALGATYVPRTELTTLADPTSVAGFLTSEAAGLAVTAALGTQVPRQVGARQEMNAAASRLRWGRQQLKQATGPANGAELTLAEVTSGGGILTHLWLAVGAASGFPQFDLKLRVYVDGQTSPVIEQDLGVLFGYAYGTTLSEGVIHTENFSAKNTKESPLGTGLSHVHGTLRFQMPFGNGIRVALANTNDAGSSLVYSQVDIAKASQNPSLVIPPWRLHSYGNSVKGALVSVGNDDEPTLHSLTGRGLVVAHAMATQSDSPSGLNYLERNIAVSIDGEATPSIKSSGLEDWFLSSYYYDDGPYSMPGAMGLGANFAGAPFQAMQTLDLQGLGQPIPFDTSLTVKCLLNPSCSQARFAYASMLLVYKRVADTFTDDFTRANSTTTLGQAPNGKTWQNGVGTWGISSGQAYNVSGTSDAIALVQTYDADQQTVTITFGSAVGSHDGIFYGAVDKDNGYIFDATSMVFARKVGGVVSVLAAASGTAAAPGDVFSMTKKANQHVIKKNGVTIGTLFDGLITGGEYSGLFAPTSTGRFTSFSVSPAY